MSTDGCTCCRVHPPANLATPPKEVVGLDAKSPELIKAEAELDKALSREEKAQQGWQDAATARRRAEALALKNKSYGPQGQEIWAPGDLALVQDLRRAEADKFDQLRRVQESDVLPLRQTVIRASETNHRAIVASWA